MSTIIASALVPVFFVMGLGYFAGKRGIIDNVNIKSLNLFLMMFCLPAALFTAIARTPREVIVTNAPLMAVLAASLLIIYALMLVLQYRVFGLSQGDGAVQTLTVSFPNFASIGLPLGISVFGQQAALPVAIAIATGAVTISPLTLTLLEMAKEPNAHPSKLTHFLVCLRKSVSKPIVVAPLLAVVFALAGFTLPPLAGKALGLIGQATGAAGLFLTGLILSAQAIRVTPNALLGVLLKNIVQPLLATGVVWLLRVPQPLAGEVVLLIAIPTGFFGLVFGAGVGVRPAVAGSTMVLSSAASIVTLAVAIALLAPHP